MLITIIFAFVALNIYYVRSAKTLKQEIKQDGGMSVKYNVLVKSLLEGDSRARIYKETDMAIVLGAEALGAYTKFEIFQGFGAISIHLTIHSNVFGLTKLKWDFKDDLPQEKMVEIISNDIAKENKKLP